MLSSPSTDRNREPRPDLSTVESIRNDLAPEEFPEGPYGSPFESSGKSTPWRPEQRSPSAYAYENRQLHAGLARDYPEDHDLHDETGSPSGDGE